jgi:hypothetical protein
MAEGTDQWRAHMGMQVALRVPQKAGGGGEMIY